MIDILLVCLISSLRLSAGDQADYKQQYDSDCPKSRHYIAAVEFTGNRRRERGMVQYSISERGIDTRQRKYRRWEGFSLSTVIVGSAMVFLMMFAIIRNIRLAIFVVGIVLFLYLIGIWRGRQ